MAGPITGVAAPQPGTNANLAGVDQDKVNKVAEADKAAREAQMKADEAKKSEEQRAADKARVEADNARAQAVQEAAEQKEPPHHMDAVEAKRAVPVGVLDHGRDEDGDRRAIPAGHHLAQKFGNDPANPKAAPGIPDNYDGDDAVMLGLHTPDVARGLEPVTIKVHPDMVSDYLRAGYTRLP